MQKSIQIFLLLLISAILLLFFYYAEIEKNVNSKFGPNLLGSNLNFRSNDDLSTGVTPHRSVTYGDWKRNSSIITFSSSINNTLQRKIDVAVIFCNAGRKSSLKLSFQKMTSSLMKNCAKNISIHFHLITDPESWEVAMPIIFKEASIWRQDVKASLHFINEFVKDYSQMIKTMQKYFSAKPGTYYSQALFYVSLRLPDLLQTNIKNLIFVDIDTEFHDSIDKLDDHFDLFDKTQLLGLAPELSPVYRHILYIYRNKHKATLLGEPKGVGFPGFNSGIILMKMDKLRQSDYYSSLMEDSSLQNLTSKYSFKGHLGDQDFFTLVGLEYPQLFYMLPCNWNRQLCQWWKSKGYDDIFDQFYECKGVINLYHGNCNSQIPSVTFN